MADGLMGKLTLDVSGVMKSIDDLQKGLANLGKGGSGNIDIPGIDALKTGLADIGKQLTEIDSKLKNLGKGGGGGDAGAQVKELINLYKELESVNQKVFKAQAGSELESVYKSQRAELEKLISDTQRYTDEQRKSAQESSAVQKARQKTMEEAARYADREAAAEKKALEESIRLQEKKSEAA